MKECGLKHVGPYPGNGDLSGSANSRNRPAINKVISEPPGHKLSECRATLDFELAFTWNPTRTTWEIHDAAGEVVGYGSRMHAAQINICPWFLEWARGARYKVRCILSGSNLTRLLTTFTDMEGRSSQNTPGKVGHTIGGKRMVVNSVRRDQSPGQGHVT